MNSKTQNFLRIGLVWFISLWMFQLLAYPLVILIGIEELITGVIQHQLLYGLAIFGIIGLVIIFLLHHKKFIPSIILSFLFPILSPLVFVWLEIHLFRQKKWLWFWYVMSAYFVLVISGYEHFRNLAQQ